MTEDEQVDFCYQEMRDDCFLSSKVESILDIEEDSEINEEANNID